MHHTKKIKARKDYQCCACNIPIPKRAVYIRTAEVQDGRWYHNKWHTECRSEFDNMLGRESLSEESPDWTWDEDGNPPQDMKDKYLNIAIENMLLDSE